jgi:hypothetical protein
MSEEQAIEMLIAAYTHREIAQMYVRLLTEKNSEVKK